MIIAVEPREGLSPTVTVIPITSQEPRRTSNAVAVPDVVKARIGLDPSRAAWIVIDDANVFAWPGFDLVPQRGGGFVRGVVTRGLFSSIREAVVGAGIRGRPRMVDRNET